MTAIFYDDWLVKVSEINADYSQRFIISGSANSDGIYLGTPGTAIARVSGAEWVLTMEWNDNAASGWQPSRIQRTASYTLEEGFIITLGADDSPPPGDGDYNDMILVCTSLDPATNPLSPAGIPFDFSLPEELLPPPQDHQGDRRTPDATPRGQD